MGVGNAAVRLHDAPRQPLRPLGRDEPRRAGARPPRAPGPRGQAGRPRRRARGPRNGGCQAPALPRARAPGGLVRARAPLRHRSVPRPMTAAANLLAFLGLTTTLLLVWRQSWPARLHLFAAQSVLLAVLAGTIGAFAGKWPLLGGGAVVLVVTTWMLRRLLWRTVAGVPAPPVAPRPPSGIPLLVAGAVVRSA